VAGGQCADLNVFNLHDYKERFDAARTRRMHGRCPTAGDALWSAPPRDRKLMSIIADTFGRNDVTYQRCSAFIYEHDFGFADHTNCQDIQAEAIREYGLTPDDVHDPFNVFMATGIDAQGRSFIDRNAARPDDHIEFLAQVDVLAVPNVCGSDLYKTSNFTLGSLRLVVRESTDEEKRPWLLPQRQYATQRGVDSFRLKTIKADRELTRDPSYVPHWDHYPITSETIPVELDPDQYALLQALRATGDYGDSDEAALREAFFTWWSELADR
jgi:uncharacterized protein YcgI (DUF1989 family)